MNLLHNNKSILQNEVKTETLNFLALNPTGLLQNAVLKFLLNNF